MSNMKIWIAGLVASFTMYLMRMIPMTFFKKPIKNKFFRSVLAYVPTAVFTSIIFPEVFHTTSHVASAFVGLLTAFILSYLESNMLVVCFSSVALVFITERILEFLQILPK